MPQTSALPTAWKAHEDAKEGLEEGSGRDSGRGLTTKLEPGAGLPFGLAPDSCAEKTSLSQCPPNKNETRSQLMDSRSTARRPGKQ